MRPILVLAAPRSGSSWFAETLGGSPSVIYRREPLTQAALRRGEDPFAHRSPDEASAGERAEVAAAFGGDAGRRALVKEVTPLRAPLLVAVADPVVVELNRHPLGIAASQHAQGWHFGDRVPDRFGPGDVDLVQHLQRLWPAASSLERTVGYTAAALVAQRRAVREPLRARYEEFVADPGRFGLLAAQLAIDPPGGGSVSSQRSGRSEAYRTDRPASPSPHHWRSTVSARAAAACLGIWRSFELADYDDALWRLAGERSG